MENLSQELPTEKQRHVDSLLDSLQMVCRIHGNAISKDALIAGLPLQNGRLTPSLVERAGARANLVCNVLKKELDAVRHEFTPAILLLEHDETCIFLGWDESRKDARVIFPELGEAEVLLSAEELKSRYLGYVIVAKPKFKFDSRAPATGKKQFKHWFWGALTENKRIYRDIMIAAFLINMFALSMPIFTMNVYDRIVPNKSVETLWVMVIGISLVIFADYLVKKGIDRSRLTVKGYGFDMPIAENNPKTGNSANRRVELVRQK